MSQETATVETLMNRYARAEISPDARVLDLRFEESRWVASVVSKRKGVSELTAERAGTEWTIQHAGVSKAVGVSQEARHHTHVVEERPIKKLTNTLVMLGILLLLGLGGAFVAAHLQEIKASVTPPASKPAEDSAPADPELGSLGNSAMMRSANHLANDPKARATAEHLVGGTQAGRAASTLESNPLSR